MKPDIEKLDVEGWASIDKLLKHEKLLNEQYKCEQRLFEINQQLKEIGGESE